MQKCFERLEQLETRYRRINRNISGILAKLERPNVSFSRKQALLASLKVQRLAATKVAGMMGQSGWSCFQEWRDAGIDAQAIS